MNDTKPTLVERSGSVRHELKTWPVYFEEIWSTRKRFEVRKNDRNYRAGDELVLKEYDPETAKYSGREVTARVTYRLLGGMFGIDKDYCVMSLKILGYRKLPNATPNPEASYGK